MTLWTRQQREHSDVGPEGAQNTNRNQNIGYQNNQNLTQYITKNRKLKIAMLQKLDIGNRKLDTGSQE